jgi:RNA ligase (TIGR02306 family)
MRKLITIRKIADVYKHPNPEVNALWIIKIDGWQCVTNYPDYKVGDEIVYIEVDAFVPVDREQFAFLADRAITWKGNFGARIKTIKLKGEYSQGLVIPTFEFTAEEIQSIREFTDYEEPSLGEIGAVDEGSIAEPVTPLGILKWEPYNPEEQARLGGATKGNWPFFLPKTDEERIQNMFHGFGNRKETYKGFYTNVETGAAVEYERRYKFIKDTDYEVSLKLDGSSMTLYYDAGTFGVCSRNLEVQEDSDLAFAKEAKRLFAKEALTCLGRNIALQGELIGPGIQGNNEQLAALEFRIFTIFDIDPRQYLTAAAREALIYDLNVFQKVNGRPLFLHVPVLERRHFDFATVDEALDYADGFSMNPKVMREGLVWKCIEDPSVHFKCISRKYQMKHGDR